MSGARQELVPVADRLAHLQLARSIMAAVAVATALVLPDRLDVPQLAVLLLSGAYVLATGLVEVGRRHLRARAMLAVGSVLLVDAVYLAIVIAATGGPGRPLGFLVFLHVVAVTLLVSYRTGLKIALWHVLLTFAVHYGQVTGLLGPQPTDVPYDAAILGAVAVLLVASATAAFSALNERELRRGHVELQALAAMGRRLEESRDTDAVAAILLDHVVTAFGFRRGVVVAADGGALASRAFETRAPVLARRLDPEADVVVADALPDARNVVVVALLAEDEHHGVLALEWGGGRRARIADRTLVALQQFTAHAALALRNVNLLREVERLATSDTLTGLPNRRVFEQTLRRELQRADRTGQPCSLAVLDVDHFKAVNDTYGHQVGDDVLRQVGAVLADICRDGDLPARFGGEEFVIVLPGCDGRTARYAAERLRRALRASGGPVPFTVSAGVASYPLNAGDATSLLSAADQALYQSKRAGRDRTTLSRRRGGLQESAAG